MAYSQPDPLDDSRRLAATECPPHECEQFPFVEWRAKAAGETSVPDGKEFGRRNLRGEQHGGNTRSLGSGPRELLLIKLVSCEQDPPVDDEKIVPDRIRRPGSVSHISGGADLEAMLVQ